MLYINVTHEVMDLDPNAMFQGRKCILNYLNSTKYIHIYCIIYMICIGF